MEDSVHSFKPISSATRDKKRGEPIPAANPPGTRNKSSMVISMTFGLLDIYSSCDSSIATLNFYRPKRYLTEPCEGVHNNGNDNQDYDLILAANDELIDSKKEISFVVKEALGKGTFGQVVLVEEKLSGKEYAAKIIKSKQNYAEFALNYEVKILSLLNKYERKINSGKTIVEGVEPSEGTRLIKLIQKFKFKNHLVLIFEKLDMSMFDLLKLANFQGFTMNVIAKFGIHILNGLSILKSAKIVHCDLKPENIMLVNKNSHTLKIIDLGSACSEKNFPFTYFQSRYYRAPEVIMGYEKFSSAVDIWSLGCILLELYLGIPIFPGNSIYDMIAKITKFCGIPSKEFLSHANNKNIFFRKTSEGAYRLKTLAEYNKEQGKKEPEGKSYHNVETAEDIPSVYRSSELRETATIAGKKSILSSDEKKVTHFVDLISKMIVWNPEQRLTPFEALKHPFFLDNTLEPKGK